MSSGKSGWQPATKGGWSKRRSPRDFLPLTDAVFEAHLAGRETVGVYPLLRGDQCALLACDFDKGTWALDALAYLDACHANGVPAVLERSRSGNGAHVWVFFDGLVAAADARAMGAALLRQAMTARAELDLSSYDRFFPSQDFLPKAGFGNLIALPLHGECVQRGTTVFLDPTTMEPWPDQWAFLSSVARMAPDAVTALAESLRPAAAGPTLSLAELAAAGGPPPPAVVRARLGAMLSIERAGLPPAVGGGVEASRVDRQPGVLREAADAILDVGHTAVHQRLRRGPRVAAPPAWAHRTGRATARRVSAAGSTPSMTGPPSPQSRSSSRARCERSRRPRSRTSSATTSVCSSPRRVPARP